MVDISNIVNVTSTISASRAQFPTRFGGTLFLTTNTDGNLDAAANQVRSYATLQDVSTAGFATNSDVYLAAAAYFGQANYAKPPFVAAYWDRLRYLPGTTLGNRTQGEAVTTAAGSGTGERSLNLIDANGVGISISLSLDEFNASYTGTDIDDWGELDIAQVGMAADTTAANTALRAFAEGITAALNLKVRGGVAEADYFGVTFHAVVTDATASANSTLHFIVDWGHNSQDGTPLGYGTLGSVSDDNAGTFNFDLGLNVGVASPTLTVGSNLDEVGESINNVITQVNMKNTDWYFITVSQTIAETSSIIDIATWVNGSEKFFMLDVTDTGLFLSALPNTTVGNLVQANSDNDRVALFFSDVFEYKALSMAGRFGGVDLNSSGTVITAKFKPLPGMTSVDLTNEQADQLDNYNINYYVPVGGTSVNMVQQGTTLKTNTFIDTRHWLDWFVNTVRSNVFDLLITQNVVPQNATGIASLKRVVTDVCTRGVRNGGVSPGNVNNATRDSIRQVTQDLGFDGNLDNGFLVHIDDITTLTDGERSNRLVPTIHVWLRGSGAVHFVNVSVTFN